MFDTYPWRHARNEKRLVSRSNLSLGEVSFPNRGALKNPSLMTRKTALELLVYVACQPISEEKQGFNPIETLGGMQRHLRVLAEDEERGGGLTSIRITLAFQTGAVLPPSPDEFRKEDLSQIQGSHFDSRIKPMSQP